MNDLSKDRYATIANAVSDILRNYNTGLFLSFPLTKMPKHFFFSIDKY